MNTEKVEGQKPSFPPPPIPRQWLTVEAIIRSLLKTLATDISGQYVTLHLILIKSDEVIGLRVKNGNLFSRLPIHMGGPMEQTDGTNRIGYFSRKHKIRWSEHCIGVQSQLDLSCICILSSNSYQTYGDVRNSALLGCLLSIYSQRLRKAYLVAYYLRWEDFGGGYSIDSLYLNKRLHI